MTHIDIPLYTLEVATHNFTVPTGATFLFSHSAGEARAIPSPSWFSAIEREALNLATIDVNEADGIVVRWQNPSREQEFSLYDVTGLRALLEGLPQPVYVDITGLSHRVWAPLMRATAVGEADVRVVYLEPDEYLGGTFRDAYKIYDLSKRFEGLRPLPGFAYVPGEFDEEKPSQFIPMVGFEGSRLEYVITQTEPNLKETYPVIGIPGFRPDYAFFAYEGNRRSFEREYLYRRVQYAKANCPFEVFSLLGELRSLNPASKQRIAMIGTKPHSLGAVLYALGGSRDVELIYDNPVRARDRSKGQSRVLVYAVSAFMKSSVFQEI